MNATDNREPSDIATTVDASERVLIIEFVLPFTQFPAIGFVQSPRSGFGHFNGYA